MSTALNSFWLCSKSTGLMSGDDGGGYSYADMLEEQFGPARALNEEGLDELFEVVEQILTGEDSPDDSPSTGSGRSPLAGAIDPV